MRKLTLGPTILLVLGLAFPAVAAEVTVKTGDVIHVKAPPPSVVYKTHVVTQTVVKKVAVPVNHVIYKTHTVYTPVPAVAPYVQRGGVFVEAPRGIVNGAGEIAGGVVHGAGEIVGGVATGVGDVIGGIFGGLFAPRVCWNGYQQYYC